MAHTQQKSKDYAVAILSEKNGLLQNIRLRQSAVIDGDLLTEDIDLYYYLAQAIVGPQHYLGVGLDSFKDCFIELAPALRQHKMTIYMTHMSTLRHTSIQKEWEEIQQILQSYNINIYFFRTANIRPVYANVKNLSFSPTGR